MEKDATETRLTVGEFLSALKNSVGCEGYHIEFVAADSCGPDSWWMDYWTVQIPAENIEARGESLEQAIENVLEKYANRMESC